MQLYTGQEAFSKLLYCQFYEVVVLQDVRPLLPPPEVMPEDYQVLMQHCWATAPCDRPSAAHVAEVLRFMIADRKVALVSQLGAAGLSILPSLQATGLCPSGSAIRCAAATAAPVEVHAAAEQTAVEASRLSTPPTLLLSSPPKRKYWWQQPQKSIASEAGEQRSGSCTAACGGSSNGSGDTEEDGDIAELGRVGSRSIFVHGTMVADNLHFAGTTSQPGLGLNGSNEDVTQAVGWRTWQLPHMVPTLEGRAASGSWSGRCASYTSRGSGCASGPAALDGAESAAQVQVKRESSRTWLQGLRQCSLNMRELSFYGASRLGSWSSRGLSQSSQGHHPFVV